MTVRAIATNPRDVRTPSPLARAHRAVSRIEMRAPENLVQAAAVPTRPPIAPADPSPLPPHATDRAEDGRDVPGDAAGERGQLELPAAGHHAHGSGRSGQSTGARVHPREQDSIPGHPRHAQERAHVQEDRSPLGRARGAGRSRRGGRRTGGSGRAVMRPIARVFVAALWRRVDQSSTRDSNRGPRTQRLSPLVYQLIYARARRPLARHPAHLPNRCDTPAYLRRISPRLFLVKPRRLGRWYISALCICHGGYPER